VDPIQIWLLKLLQAKFETLKWVGLGPCGPPGSATYDDGRPPRYRIRIERIVYGQT